MPDLLALSPNFTVDVMLTVPEITVGNVMRATAVSRQAAGRSANVARIMRQLGRDAEIGGFLGGSNGEFVQRQYESEGLRGHYVWCDGETQERVVLSEQDGRTTTINEQGITVSSEHIAQLAAHIKQISDQYNWVSFSGDIPSDSYTTIFDAARPAKLAVDCGGDGSVVLARHNIDLLCITGREAGSLLGWSIESIDDAFRACKELHSWGNALAIISLDELGAIGYDGQNGCHAVVSDVTVERTADAGDGILAGVLDALMAAQPLDEVMRRGVAVGAACCTAKAAGFLPMDTYHALLSQVTLKKSRSAL